MEEKQLKENVIEIAKSLRAKFVAENPKDNVKGADYRQEILMIRHKRGRAECATSMRSIMESMQGLTFCTTDPSPAEWKGDNPIVIQGSIRDTMIHLVYIDTGSSTDIIYEHCFRLLPDAWKEELILTAGQLTGFTGHSLWPLGTIHLLFTLTSQEKTRRQTTLVDFVVIRHPSEHNVILGRTALLKF